MYERAEQKLIPIGRTHPRLRWPILAALTLLYYAIGVWATGRAGRNFRTAVREILSGLCCHSEHAREYTNQQGGIDHA